MPSGRVTLVGLVTIAVSVYMITWSQHLFAWLEPVLGPFERRYPFRGTEDTETEDIARGHDFVVFGLGRYGCRIGEGLRRAGHRVLGVDFDPEAMRRWREMGFDAAYGDVRDPEFVAHLPLHEVKGVVSAVPRETGALTEADANMALLHGLQTAGYRGKVALAVQSAADGEVLAANGADVVLTPFADAASHAVQRLLEVTSEGTPGDAAGGTSAAGSL